MSIGCAGKRTGVRESRAVGETWVYDRYPGIDANLR